MNAQKPSPPYYAVIFTSNRTNEDAKGYQEMLKKMEELAANQEGFIGVDSSRDPDGFGITVSYWTSLEAIKKWKQHTAHQAAQVKGKDIWYSNYHTRICKVEREYGSS